MSETQTPNSSSSFDSSNSFYSTTDSNSNSSLTPLTTSPTSEIQNEQFYAEQYRDLIEKKVRMVLLEIENDYNFSGIVDLPTIKVESSLDPQTPFCFRSSAHFPTHSASSAFALFAKIDQRASWDAMCQSISILHTIDPLTFVYHLKLKSTWPTTPRDSLMMAAFRKLKDGRFISVAWSIEDNQLCPPQSSHIRMTTRISANLLTPTSPTSFKLTQLIDADPKGSIPSYLIRSITSKSIPSTIERIKSAIDPQSDHFYNDLVERENDTYDSGSSVNTFSSKSCSTNNLHDIQRRLSQIESQLRDHHQNQFVLNVSVLTLSAISALLLLNLNFRKNK